MNKEELLSRYEALGDEADFLAAKPLYERALAGPPGARLLNDYGYLLQCHARNELRQAVESYERGIAQLISTRAELQEPELAVALYEERLAAAPGEAREHRFLASAYVREHDYERARKTAEAGLELAPDDAALLALRGEAKAGLADAEGALADWRRALELDPEDIGPLYSTAFLLERTDRPAEAIAAWQSIVEWNDARALVLESDWPKRELERLRTTS